MNTDLEHVRYLLAETTTFTHVDHPLFPADAASGLPHVLELDLNGDGGKKNVPPRRSAYQLRDYIVTILANLKEHPTAIQDFFNPSIRLFRLTRYSEDYESNFMIVREGVETAVSCADLW